MKNITIVCLALILGCSTYHKRDEPSEGKIIKPIVRGVKTLVDKIRFLIKSRGVRHLLTATGEVSDEGKKLIDQVTEKVLYGEGQEADEAIEAFRKLIAKEGPVRMKAIEAFSSTIIGRRERLMNSLLEIDKLFKTNEIGVWRKIQPKLKQIQLSDLDQNLYYTPHKKAREILKITSPLDEVNETSKLYVELLYGSDDAKRFLEINNKTKELAVDYWHKGNVLGRSKGGIDDFDIHEYVRNLRNEKNSIEHFQGKTSHLYRVYKPWSEGTTGRSFINLNVWDNDKKMFLPVEKTTVLARGHTRDQLLNGVYEFDKDGKFKGVRKGVDLYSP